MGGKTDTCHPREIHKIPTEPLSCNTRGGVAPASNPTPFFRDAFGRARDTMEPSIVEGTATTRRHVR